MMTQVGHGIDAGDSARLLSAYYGRFRDRHPVTRFYDDGSGPVWIYQDAGGLLGLVRASSWETAWDIVCDEILDDADEDDLREYDPTGEALPEGCGYRPNGSGEHAWNKTGVYQEDLNGSGLRLLTAQDMARGIDGFADGHGISLVWESWDDN